MQTSYHMLLMLLRKLKDPMTSKAAVRRSDRKLWIEAMQEEMSSLNKNQTWILVNKPKYQRLVGCKWILKKKDVIPGTETEKYKARIVAKGRDVNEPNRPRAIRSSTR